MNKRKYFRFVGKIIPLKRYKKIWFFSHHYIDGLINRLDEHHVFLSAAGLAFTLMISIIPFTLIVFSILGSILDTTSVEEQLSITIDTLIPYSEHARYVTKIIFTVLPEVVEYKTLAAWIGAFGLWFAASSLFSSMRTVLNGIFGVTEDKHAVIGKLRDFFMILLLIVFLLLTTLVLPVLNSMNQIAEKSTFLDFLQISTLLDTIVSVASPLLVFFLFFVFYYVIPYEKLGKRVPAAAALWTTILWELARRLFGYYIFEIATLNRIYGTYALIAVVAFWIYYSSILFVIGAEIGQLYRERKERHGGRIKLRLKKIVKGAPYPVEKHERKRK